MYLPGMPVDDKILIFEDTDGDGRADKQTVFADGLHVPTGLELGDGGVYVAQQPNLVFLKDTDGDDQADSKEIVLGGFDTADSHHSIHAFTWDPGGGLHFQEGIFNFTQVESAYGPVRKQERRSFALSRGRASSASSSTYPFINPWGHTIDRWGQNFVADASSGDESFRDRHFRRHRLSAPAWPTEKLSHETVAADLRLRAGFQPQFSRRGAGRLPAEQHHRLSRVCCSTSCARKDRALPPSRPTRCCNRVIAISARSIWNLGPTARSTWSTSYNPIVGHMTHSMRDPNRDHQHGRIWRIAYKNRPLRQTGKDRGRCDRRAAGSVQSPTKTAPAIATRIELGSRDTDQVMAELKKWMAGLDKNDANYWHNMLEAALAAPAARRRRPGIAQARCSAARNPKPGRPPRGCFATGATGSSNPGSVESPSRRRASSRAARGGSGGQFLSWQGDRQGIGSGNRIAPLPRRRLPEIHGPRRNDANARPSRRGRNRINRILVARLGELFMARLRFRSLKGLLFIALLAVVTEFAWAADQPRLEL